MVLTGLHDMTVAAAGRPPSPGGCPLVVPRGSLQAAHRLLPRLQVLHHRAFPHEVAPEPRVDAFEEFALRQLLSKVTEENVHGEIATGDPVGKELR